MEEELETIISSASTEQTPTFKSVVPANTPDHFLPSIVLIVGGNIFLSQTGCWWNYLLKKKTKQASSYLKENTLDLEVSKRKQIWCIWWHFASFFLRVELSFQNWKMIITLFPLFCMCGFGGLPTAHWVRDAERLLVFSNSCGYVAPVRIKWYITPRVTLC